MALPSLATVDQLAGWMQMDVSALPASAPTTLEIVSAIVRAEARQSFTRKTSTVTLFPAGSFLTLPQRPVVSVDSVQRDGVDVPFKMLASEKLFVFGCEPVSVTFTYGYAEVPGDVLAVVLTGAARVLNNPSDLRQETVGSISVTYAAETIGASLSQADKDLLARYRRRAAVVNLV
ncbi:hypothetical protein OHA79_09625 [Streptomyces sp. NBC_00841]|uniref:hypothetical protein n=1 Tax=Streptomyces sp. NBC_00841 TaxID=2975847 RepID=UPI002DD99732|nr:hypothetical protein [Streptomyces sp. NBC_00841]WRZ98074.1 hypothetical protein OHA79_09625 [Streptomyces sp. NBC_00841]